MTDLPTHYTASNGDKKLIADMPYSHLVNAHRKAVSKEEREHEHHADMGKTYSNPEREKEIDALAKEISMREKDYPDMV